MYYIFVLHWMSSCPGAQVNNICHTNSQDTDRILQLTMHTALCLLCEAQLQAWDMRPSLRCHFQFCCNLDRHTQSICSLSDSFYSHQNRWANRINFSASCFTNQSLVSKLPLPKHLERDRETDSRTSNCPVSSNNRVYMINMQLQRTMCSVELCVWLEACAAVKQ